MSKRKIIDIYPLSPTQEGMLFHYLMDEASDSYYEQLSLRLQGQVDVSCLEKAWNYVIENNEILRTLFTWEKSDRPLQVVMNQYPIKIETHDLTHAQASEWDELLEEIKFADRKKGFDLKKGPTLRVLVCKLDATHSEMIFSNHHILMDGWCGGIIFRELFMAYEQFVKGMTPKPQKKYRFKDYISYLVKKDQNEAKAFWQNYLAGISEPTPLPYDFKGGEEVEVVEQQEIHLSGEMTEKMVRLTKEREITVNVLAQAAWGILLAKYANQQEAVFGATVSGRPPELPGVEEMVGLFINTIPVRLQLNPDWTVGELLTNLHQDSIQRKEYEYLPLVDLQGQTEISNNQNLFNSIFVFENFPLDSMAEEINPGFEVVGHSSFQTTNYDLNLVAGIRDGGLLVDCIYDQSKFKDQTITQMMKHYQYLLEQMLTNLDQKIAELELLSPEEQEEILMGFNQTQSDYPKEVAVHQLVEAQAKKNPDAVALRFAGATMTYSELNAQANRLAHHLRKQGVEPETMVAILADRSMEMIIGLLGILKAGGAYLPIDPEYPTDRKNYMLTNAQVEFLVIQEHLRTGIPTDYTGQIISLDDSETLSSYPADDLIPVTNGQSLAYVLYTSGSTGEPKGTLIEHQSITRLIWDTNYVNIQETDRVLQLSTYCFDAATFHIWGALVKGAELVLISKDDLLTPETLAVVFEREEITVGFITTALFNSIADLQPEALRHMRCILVGGERCSVPHFRKVFELVQPGALYHVYGPTESTTFTTTYQVTEIDPTAETISIGKPISNTQVYILDKNFNPVPVGVPGQLCISGDGLSRGYLNRPELTAEKFVPNPFKPGTMLYLSGDIAKYDAQGNIEFIGRVDHQVKIRGYRIEPGEIEFVLLEHPEIQQVVVIPKVDSNQNKYLATYLVADRMLTVGELREYLLERLPEYMIPGSFIQLAEMPLNMNGKVDRKALPEPDGSVVTGVEYVAPRNEVEEKMVQIWAQVLGVEQVGIRDNFFDLGGDSIKAIQLVARMGKAELKCKVKDIFTHQTVEKIAIHLGGGEEELVISQEMVEGEVNLTPVQRWFMAEEFKNIDHWNLSLLLAATEPIDVNLLEKVLQEMILHHDALRLNYQAETRKLYYNNQINDHKVAVKVVDLSELPTDQQDEELFTIGTQVNASMSLTDGPLLKACLFDLGQRGQRLLLAVHHLVVDGFSWRVLLEDLINGYTQGLDGEKIALPMKTTSFKDWSQALAEYSQSAAVQAEIPYWEEIVQGFQPLPTDLSCTQPATKTELIEGSLTEEETRQLLTECNRVYNTEINDLLLTALAQTMREWTYREDVVIHLEGHGREEVIENVDLSRTVGWFTSIFPVKLDLSQTIFIKDEIKTVKEQLRQIPNKGIGFGILKYLTQVESLQPKFDQETITFNYLGQFDQNFQGGLFKMAEERAGFDVSLDNHRISRLALNGMVSGGKLNLILNYSPEEYRPETITYLLDTYLKNLREVINHCLKEPVGCYTPSDFELVELDQPFLDQINKNEILDIYPLAPLQEGMLYHYVVGDATTESYVQQMYLRLKGNLNPETYRKAWEHVIHTNDVFRTLYHWTDLEQTVQILHKELPLSYQILDLRENGVTPEQLEELRTSERRGQLDLAQGPTMKITLCQLADDQYEVIWTYHHLLIDGWCVGMIMRELLTAYESLSQGKILPIQQKYRYKDYISWLQRQDKNRSNQFWKEYLKGIDTPTTLPYDYKEGSKADSYTTQKLMISDAFSEQIEEMVRKNKITVNTLFQTAWGLLLQIYNNTNDVIYGATVSGRPPELPGVEEIVGLFINSVPTRVQTDWESTLQEAVLKIHEESIARKEFENSSLTDIKAQSEFKGKAQLFESLLVFENYPIDSSLSQLDLGFTIDDVDSFYVTNYDLNLVAMHHGRDIELEFQYNQGRFSDQTIQRMMGHFRRVLETILDEPEQKINQLRILDEVEQEQVLREFNQTQVQASEKCLHELIEEQAALWPERVAVVYEDQELTYRELNEQANQWAWYLREQGVQPDTLVGMLVERSLETIVGILAIIKAGGAYVPIRSDYPAERINFMLEDSAASILLTQTDLHDLIPIGYTGLTIDLDQPEQMQVSDYSTSNLPYLTQKNNLAYIIYTSGTTGKPKGVMIEHENVVRLFKSNPTNYDFNEQDVWTMFHSYCFDFSVWEMYGALLFGGKVVVVSKEDSMDPHRFHALCKKHRVTVLNQTPAAFYNFIDTEINASEHILAEHLRYVIFGGEALNFAKLVPWAEIYSLEEIALVNMYGITETTVHVTYERIKEEDLSVGYRSLIGKPIYNTTVYLLDEFLRPVPIGVIGEMYVGGTGVARGYLNRPELTAEKFIEHPFATTAGERLYRSGDLARFTHDGNVEYLGRIDHQVKIRGFRIELGEIETALLKHPEIKEAVVLDRTDEAGNKYLVGYLVAARDLAASELRQHLVEIIPEYMVPQSYLRLDEIPLTSNGKVNRKALPEPTGVVDLSENYVEPETDLEKTIAEIWANVLGVEKVGLNDNYYDLGGDSIMAIQVVARMNKKNINCQVKDIFEYQTIGQLALNINYGSEEIQAEQGIVAGEVPLNPVQSWFISEDFADPDHWNQSFCLKLNADLNVDLLEQAFGYLLQQHDGLRMNYQKETQTLIYQNDHLNEPFTFERFDLRHLSFEEQRMELKKLGTQLKASLRLADTLLIKVGLFTLADNDHRLLITIHHMVVDGVSWRILLTDLQEIYTQLLQGEEVHLQAKTSSVKEWYQALQEYSVSETLASELPYWESAVQAYTPLPVDYTDGEDTLESVDAVMNTLSPEETELLLTEANSAYNTEINDLLLTALAQTIADWTFNDQVVINLEGHGREDLFKGIDLSRTMGWFTSIYPVMLNLTDSANLDEQIKGVKEQMRAIPNKGIGFGILKYITQEPSLMEVLKTADILFNYLGQFGQEMENDLFSLAEEDTGMDAGITNHRNNLLDINCMVVQGQLRVVISYSKNRYHVSTVEELLANYLTNLRQVIAHCSSGEHSGFTRSDFDMVDLEQDDLDALFG